MMLGKSMHLGIRPFANLCNEGGANHALPPAQEGVSGSEPAVWKGLAGPQHLPQLLPVGWCHPPLRPPASVAPRQDPYTDVCPFLHRAIMASPSLFVTFLMG